MIRPTLVRAALSALLPFACTSGQPPESLPNATSDTVPAPGIPDPPEPPKPSGGGPAGSPCQVDADCEAVNHNECYHLVCQVGGTCTSKQMSAGEQCNFTDGICNEGAACQKH